MTNPRGQTVNSYATQKTVANGLFDLALLTANGAQLKLVIDLGNSHPYFYALIVMIALSIALQLATAIILLVLGVGNIDKMIEADDDKRATLQFRLNATATGLVFIITVLNIFITAFGLSNQETS